jgi:hypothetical protein
MHGNHPKRCLQALRAPCHVPCQGMSGSGLLSSSSGEPDQTADETDQAAGFEGIIPLAARTQAGFDALVSAILAEPGVL